MTDVIMPQMGESIAEGTITKWLKNIGDKVERDEPLFEISTDKVDAEIPAPASGVLAEVKVAAGETVAINTVVGVIGVAGEASPTPPAAAASGTAATVPPVGPERTGAAPAAAPAASAATSTLSTSATTPFAVPVQAPEGVPSPEPSRSEMTVDELRRTRSSPLVRKIAAEHNVDVRELKGTGISGRVTKKDILGHIESQSAARASGSPATAKGGPGEAPAPFVPAYRTGEPVEIVAMTPIRKKTAEHMTASKRISAHVSTVFEVDMTHVARLRAQHKGPYEERNGVRLTYTPFILKAVVDALKTFPVLNASVDGNNIVYKKKVNLGVAVALDWGLIVPVIQNADEKNLLGLARAVNDLAERARAKRLKVDEIQGGTFTVTNPGVFGSLFGTPIINQPQVAILGIGTIEKRPVVRDDAIAIRTMAYLALTFDHRIVDGADADRFMGQVKQSLQEFDESAL